MIYFIADTHFGSENMIKYEKRPFSDTRELESTVINNWNKVAADEDYIYVVGDFAENDVDISGILEQLKGHKYLIKGNHDTLSNEEYRKLGFEEVYDKPIILDGFWIVSHEPVYVTTNAPYANIFGHVHGNPMYKTASSRSYCVCVERTGYGLISFDEVKKTVNLANINQ